MGNVRPCIFLGHRALTPPRVPRLPRSAPATVRRIQPSRRKARPRSAHLDPSSSTSSLTQADTGERSSALHRVCDLQAVICALSWVVLTCIDHFLPVGDHPCSSVSLISTHMHFPHPKYPTQARTTRSVPA